MEGSAGGGGAVAEAARISAAADDGLPFASPLLDFIRINLVLAVLAALPCILWVPEAAGDPPAHRPAIPVA